MSIQLAVTLHEADNKRIQNSCLSALQILYMPKMVCYSQAQKFYMSVTSWAAQGGHASVAVLQSCLCR